MIKRKIALFLMSSITMLFFSSSSTAKSEKDVAQWASGLAREQIKLIENSIGISTNTVNVSTSISSLSYGLLGFPIAETYDDVIWETLKNRLDNNKTYEAIRVMEHIKTKNISQPNSIRITNYFNTKIWDSFENSIENDISRAFVLNSYIEASKTIPDNSITRAKSFYLLGTKLASERNCSKMENALFAYKTALSLNSDLNQEESEIFKFSDFCANKGDETLVEHHIIAYVYGLKLNPSAKSYLKLSSIISRQMLGGKFSYKDMMNNGNISADIILDASKQVLELPEKNVEIDFPLYIPYNIQELTGHSYAYSAYHSKKWKKKVESSSHALAYTFIGNILAKLGNLSEANKAFQQAIRIDPNLSMAYAGLGKVQILQIKFEEAEKSLELAINLNSNYADAYNSLGSLFKKREQFQKAVDAYRKALLIDSNHSLYISNLSEAEKQLTLANQIEPKLDTSVQNSIVIVKPSKMIGDCGKGTGWIVSNDSNQAWVITNRHVIQGCNNVKIVLNSETPQSFSADVFKVDEEKDLAVLKVANLPANIEPLSIASALPDVNDTVFVVGHPHQAGGSSWTTVKGEISSILNQLLQLDITVDGGNSGSPVLNKNNEVIGLLFEVSNDKAYKDYATGRFGFAYSINVVREKLNSWEIPYENK